MLVCASSSSTTPASHLRAILFLNLKANDTIVFKLGLSDFKSIKSIDSSLNPGKRQLHRSPLAEFGYRYGYYTADSLGSILEHPFLHDSKTTENKHFERWKDKTEWPRLRNAFSRRPASQNSQTLQSKLKELRSWSHSSHHSFNEYPNDIQEDKSIGRFKLVEP